MAIAHWRRPLTLSKEIPGSMTANSLPGFEEIPTFNGLNLIREKKLYPILIRR
jgi:hypothetical protein